MSNYIPLFYMEVITYPCIGPDVVSAKYILVKKVNTMHNYSYFEIIKIAKWSLQSSKVALLRDVGVYEQRFIFCMK